MSLQLRVYVPPHPLVKHWLGVARDEATPNVLFRSAMTELGRWLTYEAVRDWLPVIETTVQARDGGTVVLGGLITDDNRASRGKVPGLGDAPIIGNLFRSRSNDQTRRTLFVFMRPTVIDSQHKAQSVAQRQFQRLRKADASEPPRSLLKERKVNRLPLEINGLY